MYTHENGIVCTEMRGNKVIAVYDTYVCAHMNNEACVYVDIWTMEWVCTQMHGYQDIAVYDMCLCVHMYNEVCVFVHT